MSESFSPTIRVERDLMLTPPAPPPSRSAEPDGMLPSPILGEYYLVREIARGGMGVVFEACHVRLARLVALKIVHHTRFAKFEDFGRFRAETEAAARLDHPNIIPIYEVGEADGLPFFTMKLIKGDSLSRRLREGPMPPEKAARLVSKIARAVQHAHERGILHRDLKPGNIVIDEQGEPWLTDFGLAKFTNLDNGLTMTGDLLGTPEYMSPEHTHGKPALLTTACDVWALGVLLHQLIDGTVPFRGESMLTTMQAIVGQEPPPLGAAPDLATIAARCLEKNPAHRLASAGFLADELDRWLAGKPIRSRHISTAERAWKLMRRHPWRVAALLAFTLSILAGSITSLVLWHQSRVANGSLTRANEKLERSLNHANSVRLASESRVQSREEAPLGLLLAAEAAELTTATGEPVLPEAFSALAQSLQESGGVDSTASRGVSPPRVSTVIVSSHQHLCPSPDGRWFFTYNTSQAGNMAALYAAAPPFADAPRRQWFTQGSHGTRSEIRTVCWTPDSLHLLTVEEGTGELCEWDVLAGLDRTRHVLGTPPVHSLGAINREGFSRESARLVRDGSGLPIGLLTADSNDATDYHALTWWPLDLTVAQPLGAAVDLTRNDGHEVRRGFYSSPDGQWVVNYDPWGENAPLLLRIQPGGTAPEIIRLEKIATPIVNLRFSPDGRWLVLSFIDGSVRLHDLAPGRDAAALGAAVALVPNGKQCHGLGFSPDGRWLAMSGLQSEVIVTPVASLPRLDHAWHFHLSGGGSAGLVFSHDSRWLAVGCNDESVNVWPVDARSESARPAVFRGLANEPCEVSFSPDDHVLAALSRGGECRRWEFNPNATGTIPLASGVPVGEPVIKQIAVSPDGRWIASAAASLAGELPEAPASPLHIYDSRALLHERELPGHAGPSGVTFSADGQWFASVGRDATLNVWAWPHLEGALNSDQPLPAPLRLVGSDSRRGFSRHVAFHPAGRLFSTSGDGVLYRWNLRAPLPAASMHTEVIHTIRYLLTDIAISPDGHWLAVGRHGNDTEPRPGATQYGNLVLLFDATDPDHLKSVAELRAPFRDGSGITFSADSRWLAVGAQDMPPDVWDLTARDLAGSVRHAPVGGAAISGVAFLPARGDEGPWLALGGLDGRLHLWDWQHFPGTLRRLETAVPIRSLAALPDGRPVTGGEDGRLRIWETDPARLIELARQTAGRELTKTERTRFQLAP